MFVFLSVSLLPALFLTQPSTCFTFILCTGRSSTKWPAKTCNEIIYHYFIKPGDLTGAVQGLRVAGTSSPTLLGVQSVAESF